MTCTKPDNLFSTCERLAGSTVVRWCLVYVRALSDAKLTSDVRVGRKAFCKSNFYRAVVGIFRSKVSCTPNCNNVVTHVLTLEDITVHTHCCCFLLQEPMHFWYVGRWTQREYRYTLCLSPNPKTLHNHCFRFLLSVIVIQKKKRKLNFSWGTIFGKSRVGKICPSY